LSHSEITIIYGSEFARVCFERESLKPSGQVGNYGVCTFLNKIQSHRNRRYRPWITASKMLH